LTAEKEDPVRWLVLGATGMLGTDLTAVLRAHGAQLSTPSRAELDLTDPDAVDAAVSGHDVVANCAAWTAVDDAEEHEGEACAINATVPRLLAAAAQRQESRLVQLSTDYVFDGRARSPYAEDSPPAPRSAYGRTKAAGERAVRAEAPDRHLIVRTAWLYGAHGRCFPRSIARVAAHKGAVSVVDDQVGQPTWTVDVADLIVRLVEARAAAGIYHATSSGETSWFGFARAVVESAGLDPRIVTPTTSDAFVRPAARPAYSVLAHDTVAAAGIEPIGAWRERWERAAATVLP
jgi:dTDP-4-dehydrorhamnose reductase